MRATAGEKLKEERPDANVTTDVLFSFILFSTL